MDTLRRNRNLVLYNIKILTNLNILAAIVFIFVTPVFFSLVRLPYDDIAKIGELYLSIVGIILFTHIGTLEESYNTSELTYPRITPHVLVFMLRLVLSFIAVFILIGSIIAWTKANDGSFPVGEILGGVYITTIYFAVIGLTISNITKNNTAGYLVAFSYYAFEFSTKGNYTKKFYTFSLMNHSMNEKYNLLFLILFLLVINFIIVYNRSTPHKLLKINRKI